MITPSKEQSKRSAAHIFAAFQYQWDYFVLQLLATNDDTITVSFELLDDVDKQTGECITLYQIKHSVQKNAKNETINLSNRDTVYLANLHTSFLCNLIYPTFSRILLYSC